MLLFPASNLTAADFFVPTRCYLHHAHSDTVATDYLRAFQDSGETSERALAITRLVLEYNASHYTAWWFRRRCDGLEELLGGVDGVRLAAVGGGAA